MDKEIEDPLVSIIVITYNSAEYVVEALNSARDQTYKNIELIISDDCSQDSTVEICRTWLEINQKYFVKSKIISATRNAGIPANCNKGIESSNGTWVKIIAGDDVITQDCISKYIAHVKLHPEKLVLFSDVEHYFETFSETNKQPPYPTSRLRISQRSITASEQFEVLLRVNKVWAGSLFFSKKIFSMVGMFDDTLKRWEDRPMLLKLTKNNIKIHFLNFVSCKYRINLNSVQRSKSKSELLTPFQLERDRYYLENYVQYLPFIERMSKTILIKQVLLLEKLNMNKSNLLVRGVLSLTAFPFRLILKYINKKYL